MPNTCYMLHILAFTHNFLSFQMLHAIRRCIGVVSALLVSTDRAMRRPQHVERADDWLHAFWYITRTN